MVMVHNVTEWKRGLIRIVHLRLSIGTFFLHGARAHLTFKRALLRVQRPVSSSARALETFT